MLDSSPESPSVKGWSVVNTFDISTFKMGFVARKSLFGVRDRERLESTFSAAEII